MKSLLQTRFEKLAINFFSRIGIAAMLILLATAPAAVAQLYTFTFTGSGGMDATGTITISGGVAQSGSISVINVPLEAAPHTPLTTAAGSLVPDPANPATLTLINHDGDDIIFDNTILAGDPILNSSGLGFASGPYQDSVHYNTLINIWGNSPGSYTLFVGEANPADLNPDGTLITGRDAQWVYTSQNGTLTLTPVPEPSSVALILCALMVGFVAIRRRAAA